MTDVGSARVEVEGDVRNFARQTERDLNRALKKVKPDQIPIEVDTDSTRRAGEKAGEALGDGVVRGVDGRLRDSRGKFVKMGDDAGRAVGKGFSLSGGSAVKAFAKALALGIPAILPLLAAPLAVLGVGMAGVIAVALAASIGSLIGAAIAAGGGFAVIGLGAALLKEEPALKSAAKSLVSSIKSEFTKAARPLLAPLVEALGVFEKLVDRIGPQLQRMFAGVAPAIVPLAKGLAALVENSLPGFVRMIEASGPIMRAFAVGLSETGGALRNMFDNIAAASPDLAVFFGDFFDGIQFLITKLGEFINWSARTYTAIRSVVTGFDSWGEAFNWAIESLRSLVALGLVYLVAALPAIVQKVLEFRTQVADAFLRMVESIAESLPTVVPKIVQGAIFIITKLVESLVAAAPRMIEVGGKLISGLVQGIINALPQLGPAVANIAGVIASGVLGQLPEKLRPLASILMGAAAGILAVAAAMKIWTAATVAWAAVTKAAIAVQTAFNVAMALNPIGLVVIAIAALVAGLIYFFTQTETGRRIWEATWTAIKAAAAAVADWFTGTVVPALSAAWNAIKSAAESVAAWYQANLAPLFNAVGALLVAVFQQISKTAHAMWTALQPLFALIGAAWSALWSVIKTVWEVIGPPIFTAITGWLSVLKAIWTATWNVLKSVLSTTWTVIKTVISTALAVITGVIKTATALIKGDWRGAWEAIKGIVSSVGNGIRTIVTALINNVRSIISAGINAVKSIWTAGWNAFSGIVSGVVGRVRSAVNSVRNAVISVFSNAGSWLLSAGRRIIDGLISGLRAGFDRVRSTLSGLTSLLPDWKGPADVDRKILEESGRMVIGGFEAGMRDEFDAVRKSLSGLTDDLPSFTADAATRGGDGASAANPGGQVSLTIQAGAIVIQGQGTQAGEEAAEAVLEKLAQAVLAG